MTGTCLSISNHECLRMVSGKLKLQCVSGRQKAADYVKILNDLSLAQEGYRLCGEEFIFQQDNAVIYNASITKTNLLEQKLRLLDHPTCSPDSVYRKFVGIDFLQKLMKEVDSTQFF